MRIPYYIQVNFAKIFGNSRIDLFKVTNNNPFGAVGRCPVCGDSQKSKTKTRFTIYTRDADVFCYCHNCSYSAGFVRFLKERDEYLYKQLLTDAFSAEGNIKPEPKIHKKEAKRNDSWRTCLIPVHHSSLAVRELEKRMIPKNKWNLLYYTGNLKYSYVDICTEMNIEIDSNLKIPEMEGIFIPFLNKEGALVFSTTRNLDPTSSLRYATLEFQNYYKMFGIERIDASKKTYVVEGPLDSLFIDNCLAVGDASLNKAESIVPKNNLVLIPDNEPRAPVQLKRIEGFIDQGFSVVLWPDELKEKDINDIVKAGMNAQELIDLNTYQGLQAKLRFKTWKKI